MSVSFTVVLFVWTASAIPLATLQGDVLVITSNLSNLETLQVTLGQAEPVYAYDRELKVYRRSGRSEEGVIAAALFQVVNASSPSFAEQDMMSHVSALWPNAHLEILRTFDGSWTWNLETFDSTDRRLWSGPFEGSSFSDCWPGQDKGMREVHLGFACDQGFMDSFPSQELALRSLEQGLSSANLVFENQLSVHLAIGRVLLPTNWTGPLAEASRPCAENINGKLESFRDYGRKEFTPYEMAAWMLLTDCFRPMGKGGTVGLAFVSTLCTSRSGYAVVTHLEKKFWLTLTHEIGHLFAAGHSFEDGEGKTGGIMDYGDGKYQGAYQFHPYRKPEICNFISRAMQNADKKNVQCWKPYKNGASDGKWTKGEWTACDYSCYIDKVSEGTKFRYPVCVNFRNQLLPPSHCSKDARPPDETEQCDMLEACPGGSWAWWQDKNKYRWVWYTDSWSECISPFGCGAGRQNQTYECENQLAEWQPDSSCDASTKPPSMERACSLEKECENEAIWVEGDGSWSTPPSCSHCEDPFCDGYQYRKYMCKDTTTLGEADESRCPLPAELPQFQATRVPACSIVDDKCCLDRACVKFTATGEDCLHRSRRLDEVSCLLSPSGSPLLYVFLGDMVRITQRCDLMRASSHIVPIRLRFPGLPKDWDRIDAVLGGPPAMKILALFKGSSMVLFSLEANAVLRGYPKPVSSVFAGLFTVCPQCARGIATAAYDPNAELLQIWCGRGDVFCFAKYRWGRRTNTSDWTLRPTLDFGTDLVRGVVAATWESKVSAIFLSANFSMCKLGSTGTTCQKRPLPHFGTPDEKQCQHVAFCSVCSSSSGTSHECVECQRGYMLRAGICVPVKVRLWADFQHLDLDESTLLRSGAKRMEDLKQFALIPGPFFNSSAINILQQLTMAPLLESGKPAKMKHWSLSFWVLPRPGAEGTVISTKIPNGTFAIVWESCGPSLHHVIGSELQNKMSCTDDFIGALSSGSWVRVEVDYADFVTLRVDGEEIRKESMKLGELAFDDWHIGAANLDVSLLQIMDYDKWWDQELKGVRGKGMVLFSLGVLIIVLGLVCMVCCCRFRIHPRSSDMLPRVMFTHWFVYGSNIFFSTSGIAIIATLFIICGVTELNIGLGELSSLIFGGWIHFFILGIGTGSALCFLGFYGMSIGKAFRGPWLNIYVLGMLWILWLQYRFIGSLSGLSALSNNIDFDRKVQWDEGQQKHIRQLRRKFSAMMSREKSDCEVINRDMLACAAEERPSSLVSCLQPTVGARILEHLVNRHCVGGEHNAKHCASCMSGFGIVANDVDWDPELPVNRLFCKCATSVMVKANGILKSIKGLIIFLMVSECVLTAVMVILICANPSRAKAIDLKRKSLMAHADDLSHVEDPSHSEDPHFDDDEAWSQVKELARARSRERLKRCSASAACIDVCALMQLWLGLLLAVRCFQYITGGPFFLPSSFLVGGLTVAILNVFLCMCGCKSYLRLPGYIYLGFMLPLSCFLLVLSFLNFGGPQHLVLADTTGLHNLTEILIKYDTGYKLFAGAFERGTYDCDLPMDEYSVAQKIDCEQTFPNAQRFENWVNSKCLTQHHIPDNCTTRVSTDPTDPAGYAWCACISAVEDARKHYWPFPMFFAAMHIITFYLVARRLASPERRAEERPRETIMRAVRSTLQTSFDRSFLVPATTSNQPMSHVNSDELQMSEIHSEKSPKLEKRLCATDGHYYTKQEFVDYFGEEDGIQYWDAAGKARSRARTESHHHRASGSHHSRASVDSVRPNRVRDPTRTTIVKAWGLSRSFKHAGHHEPDCP